MKKEELKIKLLELPDNYKGLLVIEHGQISNKELEHLKTKAHIQVLFVHSLKGLKFFPALKEE